MVALKAGLRGRGFDATLTVSTILRIASAVFVVLIIIVTFDFGQQLPFENVSLVLSCLLMS